MVGARFAARNKVPNRPSWVNKPVVTAVEPGKRFSFARTEKFAGTVEWTYELEPDATGTVVTESYRVTTPLSPVGWFIIGVVFAATRPPHRSAHGHGRDAAPYPRDRGGERLQALTEPRPLLRAARSGLWSATSATFDRCERTIRPTPRSA